MSEHTILLGNVPNVIALKHFYQTYKGKGLCFHLLWYNLYTIKLLLIVLQRCRVYQNNLNAIIASTTGVTTYNVANSMQMAIILAKECSSVGALPLLSVFPY